MADLSGELLVELKVVLLDEKMVVSKVDLKVEMLVVLLVYLMADNLDFLMVEMLDVK